jgi:hypothetical protein
MEEPVRGVLRVANRTNGSQDSFPQHSVVTKGKGKLIQPGTPYLNPGENPVFYNQDGIPITLGPRPKYDTDSEPDSNNEQTDSDVPSNFTPINSASAWHLKAKARPRLESSPEESQETTGESAFEIRQSTEQYRKRNPEEKYESFKELEPKILELCTKRLWKNRPESDFKIGRLPGGSFNRVVSISVKEPKNIERTKLEKMKRKVTKLRGKLSAGELDSFSMFATTHKSGDYILRVPRLFRSQPDSYDFGADVRTHDFVQDLGVDCPRIVTTQSSHEDNGFPYLLMEKVRGRQLWAGYARMNHQQRLQIATQIGKICSKLFLTRYNIYGKLVQLGPVYRGKTGAIVRDSKLLEPEWLRPSGISRSYPVSSIMQQGLMHHYKMQHQSLPNIPWSKLCTVTAKLAETGAFGPDGWYFAHGDFYPRNIMAEIDSDGNAQVTSVLDWDTSSFQPAVVSAKPPSWLWQWNLYMSDLGDEDNLDIIAACEPASQEAHEIKAAFDKAAGPIYCQVAYHRYAYTSRKIALWVWLGNDNRIGERWPQWVEWFSKNWETFETRIRADGFPAGPGIGKAPYLS